MNYCRNCGRQIKEGLSYCPGCGQAIDIIQPQSNSNVNQGDAFVGWLIQKTIILLLIIFFVLLPLILFLITFVFTTSATR